jgi:tRNA-2-methylthio-N6-dimethylallyladenosine synthase
MAQIWSQAMSKKVFIRTFGCQMNEYDSDKMSDVLRAPKATSPPTTSSRPT